MKEYELHYNRGVQGGYSPEKQRFLGGPAAGDDDGYFAPGHYEDDDAARWAAYTRLERVKGLWPEYNEYPYGEPKIYEREVSPWELHE